MSRSHCGSAEAEILEPRRLLATLNTIAVEPGATDPVALIAGPNHTVWYASGNTDADGAITDSGPFTPSPLLPYGGNGSAGGGLLSLARGPGNSIWSIAQGPEEVFEQTDGITAAGSAVDSFPLPDGTDAHGLVEGPDQNLYFVSYARSFVGRISTADGALTEFPIPSADRPLVPAAPPTTQDIVIDADGNVTVADGNQILRMSTAGVFAPPIDVAGYDQVDALTVFDGNVWFTRSDGQIGSLTPSGSFSIAYDSVRGTPTGITAGGDGNLWICAGDNLIGLTPGGLTDLTVGLGAAGTNLVTDDDGNVWIAEPAAGQVAELDLNPTHQSPAPTLEFTTQPTVTIAGTVIAQPVQVSVIDSFGEVSTSAAGSVTLSIGSGPAAMLGGTLTEPLVKGVATFSDLTNSGPGLYTLAASGAGDLPTVSKSFAVKPAQVPTLVPTVNWPLVPQLSGIQWKPPTLAKTIDVSLTNATQAQMSGRTTLKLFASPDGALDADSLLLLTRNLRVNLVPGGSTVVRIPASAVTKPKLPAGHQSYTLLAEAIAPNGVGNYAASGAGLSGSIPFSPPYLQVGSVAPLSVGPGQLASVWALISTALPPDTFDHATLTLLLSADGVIVQPAPVLASVRVGRIPSSTGSKNILLRFRVPANLLNQTYWPCAILTLPDYTQTVIGATPFNA